MKESFSIRTWLKITALLITISAPIDSIWAISLYTSGQVINGVGQSCNASDSSPPVSASCNGPQGGEWSGNASATSLGLLGNNTGAPDGTTINGLSIIDDTFNVNTPGVTDPGVLVFTYNVHGSVSSNTELGARLSFQGSSASLVSGTNTNCFLADNRPCYAFGTGVGEYLGNFAETVSFMFPYEPGVDFYASMLMALNVFDQSDGTVTNTVADFLNSADLDSVEALVNDTSVAFSLLDSSGAVFASGSGSTPPGGGDPGGNIPEPATLLLMGLGLAGLGGVRRRKLIRD